jgi:hypothetical protein
MTKPRPANMFEHPQESPKYAMRDKLLFTQAMVASGELTGRELRVGFMLVNAWSTNHGSAYPSMQYIADALTIDKRDVGKALCALEVKGWFIVRHGSRGRGKNHANRYIPNIEKVVSAAPFQTAALAAEQRRSESEKVAKHPGKGGKTSTKGGAGATLSGASLSGVLRTDMDDLRSSSRWQRDADAVVLEDVPSFRILEKLRQCDAWLRADSNRPLTASELRAVASWRDECDQIAELYDAQLGDPVGGMAYRIGQDFAALLEDYEMHE